MILASDRGFVCPLIKEAVTEGARLQAACREVGISARTFQRWQKVDAAGGEDRRPGACRKTPAHKLTPAEREQVLAYANASEYRSLAPGQIVPKLADQGIYVASEASFYRILREAKCQNHRGRKKKPEKKPITTHVATGPNQVWMWDITWLKGPIKGSFYYLYLVIDLFSRKVIAHEVYDSESSENAEELIQKAVVRERLAGKPCVLHSDNGSPLKASNLQEKLRDLGLVSSYSRPRVSNDNAYVERWFGTAKYHPSFPSKGFACLKDARDWTLNFVRGYNEEHQHSGIGFVTPGQRHRGEDNEIQRKRRLLYEQARQRNPRRWTGGIRCWQAKKEEALNPIRKPAEKEAA